MLMTPLAGVTLPRCNPLAGPSRISKRRKRQQQLREREKAERAVKLERRRAAKVGSLAGWLSLLVEHGLVIERDITSWRFDPGGHLLHC